MDIEKYKYKLNYLDFIKMMISSNLYDLEKYLFLQKEPLEIEVYFEEVLLSTNHNQFNIGPNMKKFANTYYGRVEQIVENLLQSNAREHFKIQSLDKEFVSGLILSYFDLLNQVDKIQHKLLGKFRKDYTPITITVSSYILNRITTTYSDFLTGDKLNISSVKNSDLVSEAQFRDLHINMACTTSSVLLPQDLQPYIKNVQIKNLLNQVMTFSDIDIRLRVYLADVLKSAELMSDILNQDVGKLMNDWDKGKTVQIYLPYYSHPSRKLTSDWSYTKCKLPNIMTLE